MVTGRDSMKQKAICILGMHRSGTSAITRSINLLSAHIGQESDLVPPDYYNSEGFWERKDVVEFHESLQRKFKTTWDSVIPLSEDWHLSEDIKSYKEELKDLIRNAFTEYPLWAWKDPRTCIFVEVWKDVLKELDVDTVFLHIIRNPLDVVRSFERIKNFNRGGVLGTWLNYNRTALRATSGHCRAFIHYDKFMQDWEGELRRVFRELGLDWPTDCSAFRNEMSQFIRPGMRHSVSTIDDLRNIGAPGIVIELYQLLEDACLGVTVADGEFDSKVGKISGEYAAQAYFFSEYMKRLHDKTEALKNTQDTLKNTQDALKNTQDALKNTQDTLKNTQDALKNTQDTLKNNEDALKNTQDALKNNEAHIAAILNSKSWKLTAPLRKIGKLI